MVNKTTVAIFVTAVMLAAAFVTAIDEDAAGSIGDTGDEFTVGNIEYEVTSEEPKEVSIIGNTIDSETELTIPENVKKNPADTESYSVTAINVEAFNDCRLLKTVTIGSNVETINFSAFSGCASLTSIEIPDNVTTIGSYAFASCRSLETVTIGSGVTTIEDRAFHNCESLTSFTVIENDNFCSENGILFGKKNELKISLIQYPLKKPGKSYVVPDGVKTIGASAFEGCTSLSEITMSDSVETIGAAAFYDCTSLSEITMSDSVKNIDVMAFSDCTSLTSISIPGSVTTINNGAFDGCTSLKVVKIGACDISHCGFTFDIGLERISIAEGASGFSPLFDNYTFFDENGKEITEESAIAGHAFRGKNGDMKVYTEPEDNGNGPNIWLIAGIIIAVIAIVGAGAYFFVRSKKQQ